jgi:hypothetical protein
MQRIKVVQNVLQECFSDVNNPNYVNQYVIDSERVKNKTVEFAIDFFQADEIPEKAIDVDFEYQDDLDTKTSKGFLWSTSKRVFFAGKAGGGLFKRSQPYYREFPYGSIARIEFERGGLLSSGKITLHISTTSAQGRVTQVCFSGARSKDKLQEFADYVIRKINTPVAPQASRESDFIAQLERLGKLKAKGLLTEEEFQAAKKKLLDS